MTEDGHHYDNPHTTRQRQSSGKKGAHASEPAEPTIETMYKQAVRFIDLTKALNDAPGRLKEQCDHLQTAGEALQKSIDELKGQAQAALDSSLQEWFLGL